MIKPNSEKLAQVIISIAIITIGCAILIGTNIAEVAKITNPIQSALVAAAPTNPKMISVVFTGADNNS